jgi:hypothetical protein
MIIPEYLFDLKKNKKNHKIKFIGKIREREREKKREEKRERERERKYQCPPVWSRIDRRHSLVLQRQ